MLHESLEYGVMQSIDRKVGMSIQQICIAKLYLMTNNIVIYYYKSIVRLYCGNKLHKLFWFKSVLGT